MSERVSEEMIGDRFSFILGLLGEGPRSSRTAILDYLLNLVLFSIMHKLQFKERDEVAILSQMLCFRRVVCTRPAVEDKQVVE